MDRRIGSSVADLAELMDARADWEMRFLGSRAVERAMCPRGLEGSAVRDAKCAAR